MIAGALGTLERAPDVRREHPIAFTGGQEPFDLADEALGDLPLTRVSEQRATCGGSLRDLGLESDHALPAPSPFRAARWPHRASASTNACRPHRDPEAMPARPGVAVAVARRCAGRPRADIRRPRSSRSTVPRGVCACTSRGCGLSRARRASPDVVRFAHECRRVRSFGQICTVGVAGGRACRHAHCFGRRRVLRRRETPGDYFRWASTAAVVGAPEPRDEPARAARERELPESGHRLDSHVRGSPRWL